MRAALTVLGLGLLLGLPRRAAADGPADSVVKVISSVRYPNPVRPWARSTAVEVSGSGVVIDGKRILTSAHLVTYATEVSVQSRPGGDKLDAKVEAVAPDLDLAVLSVNEAAFFQKHPALTRAEKLPPVQASVAVYGFSVGGNDLSVTKGVVSRIDFSFQGTRSAGLILQVSAAVNPGNSGGPAVVDGAMVGVVTSRLTDAENVGYIVPNEEIDFFLDDVRDGRYDGKPVEAAGTAFQRLENEALRRMLKLDAKVKGLLVCAPEHPAADYPLKNLDVVSKVGDYEIDNEGMVRLENALRMPFMYLFPRLARGDAVPLTVLRDGRLLEVSLPVTRHDNRLIREFNGEPLSYFIHGPLVFSPLRADAVSLYTRLNPYLYSSNGPLLTRRLDRVRFSGEELVVVTAPMFGHATSKGYDNPVGLVVKDVNGVKIKNLRHLVETFRDLKDEYLTIRFADEPSTILVFDRKTMEKATEEILEDNGIAPSRRGSPDMLKAWAKEPDPPR
jgi:S1-C subfamily serine protease